MRCPFCGWEDTQVKDSRGTEDGAAIRRRRECARCKSRFTSFERAQLRDLTVAKKTGKKELFDRDKMLRSMQTALKKRPVKQDDLEFVVNSIQRRLETAGEGEISSGAIGELGIEALASLDEVAFIRYASVYHDFSASADFKKFMDRIKNDKNQ